MHHFFVPAEAIQGELVAFPEQTGRQIQRVLRLSPGDQVAALDNSGKLYETELIFTGQQVSGKILSTVICDTEPSVRIRLMACVSQRDKYEWILQKGTELGVCEFLPVISQRTLVQKTAAIDKKRERWEAILQEAAEQSHRGKLPVLHDCIHFNDAAAGADQESLNVIAHTASGLSPLSKVMRGTDKLIFNLLIGPEGGFTADEVRAAVDAGFQPVSLGKRVLRMETAALAFVTAVLAYSSLSPSSSSDW